MDIKYLGTEGVPTFACKSENRYDRHVLFSIRAHKGGLRMSSVNSKFLAMLNVDLEMSAVNQFFVTMSDVGLKKYDADVGLL